jgi:long-chain fatty acid transport protein
LPELHIAGLAQFDPMQLQGEYARRFGAFQFVIGATYKHWSRFDGLLEPTVRCPSEQPDCGALPATPLAFHDTLVPRFGMRYDLELAPQARGSVRAGYFFEPSPLEEQRGQSNYWDNDRHAVTAGYSIELERPRLPIEASLAYQYHYLVPRTHRKSATVDSGNVGFPEVETRGSVQSVTLSLKVDF